MNLDAITTRLADTLDAALLVVGFLALFLLLHGWDELKRTRRWSLKGYRWRQFFEDR